MEENIDTYLNNEVYTSVNHTQLMDPSSTEFLLQVYLPIALWMAGMVFLLILLFKKYTFGKWTKENPNPYSGESFSMPRGVLRGIITLTLLFVVIFMDLVTVHVVGFEAQFAELMVAFQMMIAFYFGSKVMHHITSADRTKTVTVSGNAAMAEQGSGEDEESEESEAEGEEGAQDAVQPEGNNQNSNNSNSTPQDGDFHNPNANG